MLARPRPAPASTTRNASLCSTAMGNCRLCRVHSLELAEPALQVAVRPVVRAQRAQREPQTGQERPAERAWLAVRASAGLPATPEALANRAPTWRVTERSSTSPVRP